MLVGSDELPFGQAWSAEAKYISALLAPELPDLVPRTLNEPKQDSPLLLVLSQKYFTQVRYREQVDIAMLISSGRVAPDWPSNKTERPGLVRPASQTSRRASHACVSKGVVA